MNAPTERWAQGPAVLSSVWRYRWLVAAAAVVMGALGFVASQAQDEVYETSARLYLTDPDARNLFGQGGGPNLERYVPQQTERVTSAPVLGLAAEQLGVSIDEIDDNIEVTGEAEVGTLTVTASHGDPERAAAIANAVATAYQENVRLGQLDRAARATDELELTARAIDQQIAELEAAAGPEPANDVENQINVLTQRLIEIDTLTQQVRTDARLSGSGVEFTEDAPVPGRPVSPTPRRTAVLAAFLGALLASAVAYQLAGRRQRVTAADQVGDLLGVPILGTLPTYRVKEDVTLEERVLLDPRTAEAYRFAYSSLELTVREIGARSVLITSANPNTGKTETALQLAVTARTRGQDVLLVDADVRMRGLSNFLHATNRRGLLDLADTDVTAAPALVRRYDLTASESLPVLASGRSRAGGVEQVHASCFGPPFSALLDAHDLTLVDSPPLLSVADTTTIAEHTDAVVLVVKEGSYADDLERVGQRLRFVGRRLIGVVYLSPSALQDTSFDYGIVRSPSWRASRTELTAPASRPSAAASARSNTTVEGSETVLPVATETADTEAADTEVTHVEVADTDVADSGATPDEPANIPADTEPSDDGITRPDRGGDAIIAAPPPVPTEQPVSSLPPPPSTELAPVMSAPAPTHDPTPPPEPGPVPGPTPEPTAAPVPRPGVGEPAATVTAEPRRYGHLLARIRTELEVEDEAPGRNGDRTDPPAAP